MRLDVFFCSVRSVFLGVNAVSMRQMRMVSGFLVMTIFVMPGGFAMVTRCVVMMLSCLSVMMRCFL